MRLRKKEISGDLPVHLRAFTPPVGGDPHELWRAYLDHEDALDDWEHRHPEDAAIVQAVRAEINPPDQPWDYDAI